MNGHDDSVCFVTISFSGEISNLILQARSLALFGQRVVKNFVVVWNEPYFRRSEHQAMLDRVAAELAGTEIDLRILWRAEISASLDAPGSGHGMQQILKLLVSHFIDDRFYVLLDSKNHAIRYLDISDFITQNRMRVFLQNYKCGDLFHQKFNAARDIFGIPPKDSTFKALPSTTPYTMSTMLVREMLRTLSGSGCNWQDRITVKIQDGGNVTEFSLYNAYLERLDIVNLVYEINEARISLALFAISPTTEDERIILIRRAAAEAEIKFFGIHKRRLENLTPAEKIEIENIWVQSRLFNSSHDARIMLDTATMP